MGYIEAATQITIAALQSEPGSKLHKFDEVAAFYETVYKKILEMDTLKGRIQREVAQSEQ